MLFCWLRFQRADSPEQALDKEHICNWQKIKNVHISSSWKEI